MEEFVRILSGVATAVIAIFAGLTWKVYMQIRDLAKRTNEISGAMLDETSRARRERVRPAVMMRERRYSGSPKEGHSKVEVELENVGVGNAYDVRILRPLRPDGSEAHFNLMKPGGTQRTQLEIGGEYRPSEVPGTPPFEPPPYEVELLYRDLYGNELETTQVKQLVRTVGVEVLGLSTRKR